MMSSAPATTSNSIGRMCAPRTVNGVSETGEGKRRASRPQMFSAMLRKMMPSAIVAMIQPNSDRASMAGRTAIRSTTEPCTMPKMQTRGIISQ